MKKIMLTLAALLLPAAAFAQTAPATMPAPTAPTRPAPATSSHHHSQVNTATPAPMLGKVVNVNTASAADLTTIPGINAKIAADVIKNRPYKNAAELVKKVKGIGSKNVLKMQPYISF
ncbi:helix-hairpin-helix domain-containing protein [Deinococcus sp.]|uniref:ComEA family DNA-binding protein n=1 Tax=Deinococcus sp. TaxID=47478 RepID=UPI0025BE8164|nr:helix-hairpin-helix domain-containing protein [Deinococcus sp.]